MVSLVTTTFKAPTFKVGLGGNYYIVCNTKEKLVLICKKLDKSSNSIYYNNKYNCWTIRIKSKRTKEKLVLLGLLA